VCEYFIPTFIYNIYLHFKTVYGKVLEKTVAFHVKKNIPAGSAVTIIPFEITLLNMNSLGGAGSALPFNLGTGVFTAPVSGYYHFDFTGINQALSPSDMTIYLQTNSLTPAITWRYADGFSNIAHAYANGYMTPITCTATILLNRNDKVRLYKGNDVLLEDNSGCTSFSGFLLRATE